MKSPLVYASRCLSDMEDRWIPYSSLWWRFWTPRIPRGERYQEGAFAGYTNGTGDDDEEDLSEMSLLDIRRMLANPVIRRIYKKLPYIDVVPVKRPYDQMPQSQRDQRDAFVIESTLAAYAAGKALYPRETIAHIEAQLTAAGITLARRRRKGHHLKTSRLVGGLNVRQKLFSHCEAPQTAFLSFPSFDNVTTHISTWAPGAELALSSDYYGDDDDDDDTPIFYRPGRSQIEFRTIQELTQLDSANRSSEQFAPDSWVASIGYQPVVVCGRATPPELMVGFFGEEGAQMGVEGLRERLGENLEVVGGSGEWGGLEERVRAEGGVLRGVDKVVFFYGNGMSDDCDYCKRAMFLFAEAVCLRELVVEASEGSGKRIPIYMPAFDTLRRWNAAEQEFLEENGVEFVESNGELFLKVDERTVVVSYRNWNPVKQVVADIAKPAAMICRPVSDDPEQDFGWKEEELEDGSTLTVPTVRSRLLDPTTIVVDPDSPRVRRLVKDYDKFELPELPGTTADKEVLSLYLRKPDASTKVEYW
ncbi:hypothetical protein C8A01DRAFT_45577 [Parachaetomium inaequale]|uniref:SRR1-like domain-containing protein n=1 Tax=Parachaetomium inaequale TaxID=2588326 RepID=A0AAN6SSR7_9PEZI|nr:hypothetical protein C8A01DRAFT_45577 [Parachaetomium inaequale]